MPFLTISTQNKAALRKHNSQIIDTLFESCNAGTVSVVERIHNTDGGFEDVPKGEKTLTFKGLSEKTFSVGFDRTKNPLYATYNIPEKFSIEAVAGAKEVLLNIFVENKWELNWDALFSGNGGASQQKACYAFFSALLENHACIRLAQQYESDTSEKSAFIYARVREYSEKMRNDINVVLRRQFGTLAFTDIDVPGDGSCYFHAVLLALMDFCFIGELSAVNAVQNKLNQPNGLFERVKTSLNNVVFDDYNTNTAAGRFEQLMSLPEYGFFNAHMVPVLREMIVDYYSANKEDLLANTELKSKVAHDLIGNGFTCVRLWKEGNNKISNDEIVLRTQGFNVNAYWIGPGNVIQEKSISRFAVMGDKLVRFNTQNIIDDREFINEISKTFGCVHINKQGSINNGDIVQEQSSQEWMATERGIDRHFAEMRSNKSGNRKQGGPIEGIIIENMLGIPVQDFDAKSVDVPVNTSALFVHNVGGHFHFGFLRSDDARVTAAHQKIINFAVALCHGWVEFVKQSVSNAGATSATSATVKKQASSNAPATSHVVVTNKLGSSTDPSVLKPATASSAAIPQKISSAQKYLNACRAAKALIGKDKPENFNAILKKIASDFVVIPMGHASDKINATEWLGQAETKLAVPELQSIYVALIAAAKKDQVFIDAVKGLEEYKAVVEEEITIEEDRLSNVSDITTDDAELTIVSATLYRALGGERSSGYRTPSPPLGN